MENMLKGAILIYSKIFFILKKKGEIMLDDIDIYDDDEEGEVHKGIRLFIKKGELDVSMIELDNGDEIPLCELSLNELKRIFEEIT